MSRPVLLLAVLALLAASSAASTAGAQVPLVYGWEQPRCPSTGAEVARIMAECIQGVMFPRTKTGEQTANSSSSASPDVSLDGAVLLCRQSRSIDTSRSLSQCMRGLLFERSGLGARRKEIDEGTAATACRYATDLPRATQIEECMRRLLYDRGGLGYTRTDVTPDAAAYSCQTTVAPAPLTWPYGPAVTCQPPRGDEAVRFLDECVKRLTRARLPANAAAVACEGALSWAP